MAISICAARPAAAQSITLVPCWRPMVGVGVGAMVNGDRNGAGSDYEFEGKGAAQDVSASIDVPVGGEWAARIEAGRVSWAFEYQDFLGRLLQRDELRLKRLTAAAMKILRRPVFSELFMPGGLSVGIKFGF